MTIDLRFFPHIIDMILSHSSFEVLRTFYDMSTRYEQCVLPFFLKHISISLQEDGSGALDRLDTSVNFVGLEKFIKATRTMKRFVPSVRSESLKHRAELFSED